MTATTGFPIRILCCIWLGVVLLMQATASLADTLRRIAARLDGLGKNE